MSHSGRRPSAEALPAALATAIPGDEFWEWPAIVAVSGGADSVALLLGLLAVCPRGSRRRLVVAHAHHGLRAAAEGDLEFVVDLAGRVGLPVVTGRLAVATGDGVRGEGLEARARRMRYRWLLEEAHEAGARHVVVAHTADDQAETVLHRILRGTGVGGLAGMKPARRLADGVALVRPLLSVRRAEVRAYLESLGQPWREDESNADRRFARSFLRTEILPRVEAGAWPGATGALVRLSAQAAALSGALESAAGHLLDVHARPLSGGGVGLDATALRGLDPHLVAEACALLWRREGWPLRDMTARHFRQVAGMIAAAAAGDAAPTEACLPGGVVATSKGAGRVDIARR